MVVESPLRLPWVLCQAYDAQIFTAPTRSPQKPKNLPLLKRMTQKNTAFEQFSNILPRLDVFVTGRWQINLGGCGEVEVGEGGGGKAY